MVDDVVSDFLGFGVERHDGLLEDVHLFFDVDLLFLHLIGLILGLRDGALEHHVLFVESFALVLDLLHSLLQEFFVGLHLLELV